MSTSVKLNTKEFSSMLSRVSKCSIRGSLDILAECVEIKLDNGVLSVRTTDTRNSLIVRKSGVEGSNFDAVILLGLFGKVVSKTQSEQIELVIDDTCVELNGNGTYKFERQVEGDQPVRFEPISLIDNPEFSVDFSLTDVKDVVKYNGEFVGSPFVDSTVAGYFFGDNAITTDGYNAGFYRKRVFSSPNTLMLYETTFLLLSDFVDDKIKMLKRGDKIQFVSSDALLTTMVHQYSKDFPVSELSEFLQDAYPNMVVISASATKATLERVLLFIDNKSDEGIALMSFDSNGIAINDNRGRVNEFIPYKSAQSAGSFSCRVSVPDLIKMMDVGGDDEIRFSYGNERSVRFDSGELTRILALHNEPDNLDVGDGSVDFTGEEEIGDLDVITAEDNPVSMSDIQW